MSLPLYLAVRNLLRNPARNFLYILGISITAALLLDMILLSSGLSVSLERILNDMGYEIRISPRGTLPFETDAQILEYSKLKEQLGRIPAVDHIDAMLGTTVEIEAKRQTYTTFALGLDQRRPVLYKIISGSEPGPGEILINAYLAREKHLAPGDRVFLRIPGQSQTTGRDERAPFTIRGIAYYALDAEGQFTISCPLAVLQRLMQQQGSDPVSAIMIRLKKKDSPAASRISVQINASYPQITSYTIDSVIRAVDKQLSYFKQFAYILGGISLVTTFVLIFIITTISFHDRVGEIALLRAIGLSHRTIFTTVLLEGIVTSIASAIFGFLLGKLVALYLDAILTSAPGLPETFSFFVMQPQAVWRALITLLLTGFFAGLYPASAAISLPVAGTLREEML